MTIEVWLADGLIAYHYVFNLHHNCRKLLNGKDDVTKFQLHCVPLLGYTRGPHFLNETWV